VSDLNERMAQAFRGEIDAPSDDEIIGALEAVLGRRATASEIWRVFAAVESTARSAARAAFPTTIGKGKGG